YFGFALTFIALGFLRSIYKGLRLLHIYIIFYLSLHLLWPYTTYDRFLMPLLPFLLLFLILELQAIGSRVLKELQVAGQASRKISALFISLALIVMVGIALFSYGSGIQLAVSSLKRLGSRTSENAETIEWVKTNTELSDVLVCENDPVYYLYSGRKATRSSPLREGAIIQTNQLGIDKTILSIISENNAKYLIITWSKSQQEDELDPYERGYKSLIA